MGKSRSWLILLLYPTFTDGQQLAFCGQYLALGLRRADRHVKRYPAASLSVEIVLRIVLKKAMTDAHGQQDTRP